HLVAVKGNLETGRNPEALQWRCRAPGRRDDHQRDGGKRDGKMLQCTHLDPSRDMNDQAYRPGCYRNENAGTPRRPVRTKPRVPPGQALPGATAHSKTLGCGDRLRIVERRESLGEHFAVVTGMAGRKTHRQATAAL